MHLLNSNACHMPCPSHSPCLSDKDASKIREAHHTIFCTLRSVPPSLGTLFSNTISFFFPYIPSSTHCAHNIHILPLWSQSWTPHQTMDSSNTKQSFEIFQTLTNWQLLSGWQVKNYATVRKTIFSTKNKSNRVTYAIILNHASRMTPILLLVIDPCVCNMCCHCFGGICQFQFLDRKKWKKVLVKKQWKLNGIHDQQDRLCTYNVTLRSVRVTVVAVEKQNVLHIVGTCL